MNQQIETMIDGRPFSFEGHEYLRAIYDAASPHVVLSKAAQIGGTTWAILRSLHACLNGLNVMYFFPTRTDVLEFSKSRVGPLLQDNPFLSRLMTDTDTAIPPQLVPELDRRLLHELEPEAGRLLDRHLKVAQDLHA